MHFNFEALPTELQMRIISYTDIVTDTPARNLTNILKRRNPQHQPLEAADRLLLWPNDRLDDTDNYGFPDPAMCCGRCEGFIDPDVCTCRPMQSVCACTPGHRTPHTLCECLVLAHPVLATNRNMRALALDYVYRNALFEIGPNPSDNIGPIEDTIFNVDEKKLACVKNLRVIINLKNEDSDEGLDAEPCSGLHTWWKPLFSELWQICKRHDARIEVIMIGFQMRAAEDLVGALEEMVESLGYHNITFRVSDDTWLKDRENGWTV